MTSRAPSSTSGAERPAGSARLVELTIGGPTAPWRRAGFALHEGVARVGGVALRFAGGDDPGITEARLRGLAGGEDPGGLPLRPAATRPVPASGDAHPLGVTGIDHVVALTPDFDATRGALETAGLDLRRTREAGGGVRQAFFVIGPCLLELAGPVEGAPRLWGLTLVVSDLDRAAEHVGARAKDAVQPGRRIATVPDGAGLGVPVALMTPRG